MNRRRAARLKKRMPCALKIEQKHHSGVVLDLSASGFFIQTGAAPPSGTPVRLELHVPGEEHAIVIHACVARRKSVPAQLKNVAQGGLGLRIESAPEEYYAYLATLGPKPVEEPDPMDPAKPAPPRRREKTKLERQARRLALRRALGPRRPQESQARYRVRVGQGARCRSLELSAGSEEEARERAAEQVGSDWKVLDCEALGS